jgi:hypothetical protein
MKKTGKKPTEELYIILLKGYTYGNDKDGKNFEKAKSTFYDDMEKWKIPKTIIMYNIFLKLCDKTYAEKVLSEIKKNKELKMDIYTYTILISKLPIKMCFELLESVKKDKTVKLDIHFYNSFMNNLKNSENEELLSFELFKIMIDDGIRPTIHTFSILLGFFYYLFKGKK